MATVRCGDTGTCTGRRALAVDRGCSGFCQSRSPAALRVVVPEDADEFAGRSFSISEPVDVFLTLFFCCNRFSFNFASSACNRNCSVSSSSSSSSSEVDAGALTLGCDWLWVLVDRAAFKGEGDGEVRSWYLRMRERPLGELRRASKGERGGHC